MLRAVSLRRRARFVLATSPTFERAVRAVPGLEARAWRSARRYVAGATAQDAIDVARRLARVGLGASIDLFGERTPPDRAPAVAAAYEQLCAALATATEPSTWLSLDLSHIAFDGALLDRIAAALPPGRRLQIGAEEAAHAERALELTLAAARRGRAVELTLQANLRRAPGDVEQLAAAGVPVRLVKGAYVESPADALPWGSAVDDAYRALARQLTAAGADVALATHDAKLRAPLLRELPRARCELLLGILPDDAVALAATGRDTRVYVPFGPDWLRFLLRRRAESQGAG
jgi:proline dehydrogenase